MSNHTSSKPTHEPVEAMTDQELVAAYLEDERTSVLGVDFYLAGEMEDRGFRSRRTNDLTAKGRKLAK